MANLNRLAETAVNGLEKSMLGGVKKESAVKAIKEVAEEGSRQIEQLTQTASSQSARITGLSQEVQTATQQLKNANASLAYSRGELAAKDKALAETTEQLTKTKSDLKKAKATKKGVSKLKDGTIQEVAVNKNGTRMKTVKDPNGNVKSYEVEQLDGSVRKTEFDALSGKRVQTKTNTTGEEVTMDYDLAGKNTKVSTKAEPKPELVKRSKVDNNKIVEEFSDGSKAVRTQMGKGSSQIEKFDKSGKKIELYQEVDDKGFKQTLHASYGENETVVTNTVNNGLGYEATRERVISTNEFGEKFISQSKMTSSYGEIVYKPTQTDMMGNVIKGESVATYKLPEDAVDTQVKTVKTSFEIDNSNKFWGPQVKPTNDTVITRDGSRLERRYDSEGRLDNNSQRAYSPSGRISYDLKDKVKFGDYAYAQEPLSANNLGFRTDVDSIIRI